MGPFNRNQAPIARHWIRQVVCFGGPASILFSSIPAGYENARLTLYGRTTSGGVIANWLMFNEDATSANYDGNQELQGSNTSSSAAIEATGVNGITAGIFTGPTGDSLSVGSVVIDILAYSKMYFQKNFVSISACASTTAGNNNARIQGGRWKSTAPITSMRLTAGGSSAYVDGTTATLLLIGV